MAKANGLNAESFVIDKSSFLWKAFSALLKNEDFRASDEDLVRFCVEELNVTLERLRPMLRDNLPAIVLAYMNVWTGWHSKDDFQMGKIQIEFYFQRFQKFLQLKMEILIKPKTQHNLVMNLYSEKLEKKKPSLPYAICIKCPPRILNTMVFADDGDDVVMKHHVTGVWKDLSTLELVNWPYVEVRFSTEDICFVRKQVTEYERYLNFQIPESEVKETIIDYVDALKKKTCYTYNFLEEYFKEYRNCLKIRKVSSAKLEEIETILGQFLEDVKYINVNNSIATNTTVRFHLSKVPFCRNKKLIKSQTPDDSRVAFSETVHPKIEIVLLYFKAKQNDTPHISFEYTDKIKSCDIYEDLCLPQLQYRCTFCRVSFDTLTSKTQMMDHLRLDHNIEQQVRCTGCNEMFQIQSLARNRWKHQCSGFKAKTKVP